MNTLNGVTMRCGAVVRSGDRLTHPDLAGSILIHPHCFQVFDATGTSAFHGSRCWGATADVTLDAFLRDVLGRRFSNAQAQAQGDEVMTLEELHGVKVTDRVRIVLRHSADAAQQMGHYIGTEHLLVGIAREGGGVACNVLQQLGINLAHIEPTLRRLLGRDPVPPDPTVKELVAQAEERGRVAERERCVKIAEGWTDTNAGKSILEAIRDGKTVPATFTYTGNIQPMPLDDEGNEE